MPKRTEHVHLSSDEDSRDNHQNGYACTGDNTKLDLSPIGLTLFKEQSDLNSDVSPFSPPHTPDIDPWELPEFRDDDQISWNDLDARKKLNKVLTILAKFILLTILLYVFICSLDFLSSAFRLIGGRTAGNVISKSELLRNPVVGVMIGVLVTVLVQSSSTSTSIVVTMVASELIRVRQAIPIVMGANIGTSITNTIVSFMQASDRNEFRRAFAAATVHDMFNWLTVIVLLPVELVTGYLEHTTQFLVDRFHWSHEEQSQEPQFLKKLTTPLTKTFIELDSDVITKIAMSNATTTDRILKAKSRAIVNSLDLSDQAAGILLLTVSLITLCICLISIVKLLHSMLRGKIAVIIRKYVNAEYKRPWSYLIGYLAILIGCLMTILVQSSSIFTSALTPLAGIGVISLERVYPLTLGSNVGTTTTGILAALTSDSRALKNTLQLAFCHLFFNISGILLFYPIPWMRFPIQLAKMLGNTTANYRWFSIAYLTLMFFILPLTTFLLSLAGPLVFIIVGGMITVTIFSILAINLLQEKKPSWLPFKLQNWDWLPLWLHSLDPLDHIISKLAEKCVCLRCCLRDSNRHDGHVLGMRSNQSQLHIFDGELRVSSANDHHSNHRHSPNNDNYISFKGANYVPVETENTKL